MFHRFARLFALLILMLGIPAHAEEEFLNPEVAFRFSARMVDDKTLAVTYDIADGYYMYRERFAFAAQGATLGKADIPPGKVKFDETFNKEVETYRKQVVITIPVDTAGAFTLTATSQGCSDKGLCYSPQEARARLTGAGGSAVAATALDAADGGGSASDGAAAAANVASPDQGSELGRIESALKGGRLLVILPLFALLGLGLSFTPCVLPMVPILSSIVVGEGAGTSRARGLLLSVTYALGMAIVYTGLGVAAGLIGEGLAAALQNPWVLGAFGLLMATLALSMFGFYELQVPAALQSRLSTASNRQSSGKLAGVFAMGAISALIVGPCVAAPLAGALVYISQTRDVLIGGGALFAMAVGMSVPLLLVGVSAGALLPRAGRWMENVKRFFGVLLLAMALWLVSPVLPAWLAMAGFALLGMGYGVYLIAFASSRAGLGGKLAAAVFFLFGGLQLVGVATGGTDVLAPIAHLTGGAHRGLEFKRIKTVAQLDAALAQTGGKTVLLDFYADWCVSCKEMEKLTFVKPEVRAKLADTILLQVDVTANDEDDKAMLKRFNLFGPPGIIMFDARGREIADARVIGFQDADTFLKSLARLQP
ncbi:protein-disulfide reductase DsbD [Pseudoduganella namucuonensis]|uniref:Thiol:disulfide interchange protein DsbD n=1 Tax=Pseudoduganella namucuonensis TaxID=1035707 RepID=A0A1I7KEY9_9BURK|nr:protein-disulfide reductase DsbD [Pseudoduganella namucuonensis]SFU95997.1 Thiol:disulfide interchange protein DsbD [Pseudoduganella namucuonensis]